MVQTSFLTPDIYSGEDEEPGFSAYQLQVLVTPGSRGVGLHVMLFLLA